MDPESSVKYKSVGKTGGLIRTGNYLPEESRDTQKNVRYKYNPHLATTRTLNGYTPRNTVTFSSVTQTIPYSSASITATQLASSSSSHPSNPILSSSRGWRKHLYDSETTPSSSSRLQTQWSSSRDMDKDDVGVGGGGASEVAATVGEGYDPAVTTGGGNHHSGEDNVYEEDNFNMNGYLHTKPKPGDPGGPQSSKYMDYPTHRAFINSDYPPVIDKLTKSVTDMSKPERTVNTYPTSDRDAVISALKNLQDKVKKLELERTEAEKNLYTLASETEEYKQTLNHDKTSGKGKQFTFGSYIENGDGFVAHQAKELEGQLSSAEHRCRLLEEQLESMRTLVHTSERSRRELMEKAAQARQEKEKAVRLTSRGVKVPSSGKGVGMSRSAGDVGNHLDRLNELERDQMKLTATQSLAENLEDRSSPEAKIRELEQRVQEERLHRRMLQERTAHLESDTKHNEPITALPRTHHPPQSSHSSSANLRPHAPRIPVTTQTPHVSKKSTGTSASRKKPPKKKLKKKPQQPPVTASGSAKQTRPGSGRRPTSGSSSSGTRSSRHYRLNLAEIPFVAGQSTSASHSLGANVQKVLAMMKTHNKALCSSHPHPHTNGHHYHRPGSPTTTSSSSYSSGGEGGCTESSNGLQDLGELLAQLQDEFGQLCSQQQDVMSELHAAHANRDLRLQEELEARLDTLVSRMENKSGQIAKIRLHQNKLENGKKTRPVSANKVGMKSKRPHSAGSQFATTTSSSATTTNGYNHRPTYSHEQYQNNNVRPGPRPHSCHKPIGHSAMGRPALYMLRDMKKLQSTLRRDDLSWE